MVSLSGRKSMICKESINPRVWFLEGLPKTKIIHLWIRTLWSRGKSNKHKHGSGLHLEDLKFDGHSCTQSGLESECSASYKNWTEEDYSLRFRVSETCCRYAIILFMPYVEKNAFSHPFICLCNPRSPLVGGRLSYDPESQPCTERRELGMAFTTSLYL